MCAVLGSGWIRMFFGPLGPASRSFYQEKTVRKTLILLFCTYFFDFLSLTNDVNVPVFRIRMFLGLPDPDPLANGTGKNPRIRIRIRIPKTGYGKILSTTVPHL